MFLFLILWFTFKVLIWLSTTISKLRTASRQPYKKLLRNKQTNRDIFKTKLYKNQQTSKQEILVDKKKKLRKQTQIGTRTRGNYDVQTKYSIGSQSMSISWSREDRRSGSWRWLYGSKNKMDFHTIHGISSCVIQPKLVTDFLISGHTPTPTQASEEPLRNQTNNMLLLPFVVFWSKKLENFTHQLRNRRKNKQNWKKKKYDDAKDLKIKIKLKQTKNKSSWTNFEN